MTDKPAIYGDVLARDVSFEDYMRDYAEDHAEWIEGMVIKLSPVASDHDTLFRFLIRLLDTYLEEASVGILRVEPFVMRCVPGKPGREPDLHIVLKHRAHILKDTLTDGPADVVIEIISPESVERDTEEKYLEYQAGGVQEYWLFDPLEQKTHFYHLNTHGKYELIPLQNGVFRSRVLPRFQLDTALLWCDALPTARQILAMVEAMLSP